MTYDCSHAGRMDHDGRTVMAGKTTGMMNARDLVVQRAKLPRPPTCPLQKSEPRQLHQPALSALNSLSSIQLHQEIRLVRILIHAEEASSAVVVVVGTTQWCGCAGGGGGPASQPSGRVRVWFSDG